MPPMSPLERGSAPDHTSFSNYIVLGHPRCGSNLVLRALGEHPQIRMIGEILSENPKVRTVAWNSVNPQNWPKVRGLEYQPGQDGAAFLKDNIFREAREENIMAFGFKFFYHHAQFEPAVRSARDLIVKNEDIRVIHLIRRNLLYALISREVAERTDRWARPIEDTSPTPPPPEPFHVEPSVCEQYFNEIIQYRQWAEKAFAKHPVLTIEYERELSGDFLNTAWKIYDFLGAIRWYVKPRMQKQQGLTAVQQLSNFYDLQRYFKFTAFSEYFAEAESADCLRSASVSGATLPPAPSKSDGYGARLA